MYQNPMNQLFTTNNMNMSILTPQIPSLNNHHMNLTENMNHNHSMPITSTTNSPESATNATPNCTEISSQRESTLTPIQPQSITSIVDSMPIQNSISPIATTASTMHSNGIMNGTHFQYPNAQNVHQVGNSAQSSLQHHHGAATTEFQPVQINPIMPPPTHHLVPVAQLLNPSKFKPVNVQPHGHFVNPQSNLIPSQFPQLQNHINIPPSTSTTNSASNTQSTFNPMPTFQNDANSNNTNNAINNTNFNQLRSLHVPPSFLTAQKQANYNNHSSDTSTKDYNKLMTQLISQSVEIPDTFNHTNTHCLTSGPKTFNTPSITNQQSSRPSTNMLHKHGAEKLGITQPPKAITIDISSSKRRGRPPKQQQMDTSVATMATNNGNLPQFVDLKVKKVSSSKSKSEKKKKYEEQIAFICEVDWNEAHKYHQYCPFCVRDERKKSKLEFWSKLPARESLSKFQRKEYDLSCKQLLQQIEDRVKEQVTFASGSEYRKHYDLYHKKYGFKCIYSGCDKESSSWYNFVAHLTQHDRENGRPFYCTYSGCGRRSSTKHNLIKHLQGVHKWKIVNKEEQKKDKSLMKTGNKKEGTKIVPPPNHQEIACLIQQQQKGKLCIDAETVQNNEATTKQDADIEMDGNLKQEQGVNVNNNVTNNGGNTRIEYKCDVIQQPLIESNVNPKPISTENGLNMHSGSNFLTDILVKPHYQTIQENENFVQFSSSNQNMNNNINPPYFHNQHMTDYTMNGLPELSSDQSSNVPPTNTNIPPAAISSLIPSQSQQTFELNPQSISPSTPMSQSVNGQNQSNNQLSAQSVDNSVNNGNGNSIVSNNNNSNIEDFDNRSYLSNNNWVSHTAASII